MKDRDREASTASTYTRVLRVIGYTLEAEYGVSLQEADEVTMNQWRESLHGYARSTTCLYVGVVQSFHQWAARQGHMPSDPSWQLAKPRRRRGIPRPMGEEPLLVAIESAPRRIRPWLILAACAGLRCCEIATLRREDIFDSGANPYMAVHGKGDKWRVVAMSSAVWDELLAYGLPPRGPIFLRRDGKPNRPGGLSWLANRYLHDLGITDTMHAIRHRFATQAHDAVPDILALATILGHDDVRTTQVYARGNEARQREMVDAVQVRIPHAYAS